MELLVIAFSAGLVYIDYDNQELKVYTPGTYKYPKGGYLLKPQFSTLPMQMAEVRDNRDVIAKFYLDTGAGLCFLMNDDFAKDSAVFKKKRKMYLTQAEGLGWKNRYAAFRSKRNKNWPLPFSTMCRLMFSMMNIMLPIILF